MRQDILLYILYLLLLIFWVGFTVGLFLLYREVFRKNSKATVGQIILLILGILFFICMIIGVIIASKANPNY